MPNLIKIVVAGDVNSGKSTLIGRYLYESGSLNQGAIEDIQQVCKNLERNFEFAYLLDSFQEEREKELTINTTQCFCKSGKRNILFIDVPGHQELLKNMLSGASHADTAILVIDINKPINDQTKRHAFILKFLGISNIITIINKMDICNFNQAEFLRTKKLILDVFKNIGIEFQECLPVSSSQGENLFKRSKMMPWYKGKSLKELLDNIKIKKNPDNFRFLIQDVYKKGGENIAAGILSSGRIKKKSAVFVYPEQKEFRIEKIKYFNKSIRFAKAPLAIGITLNNNYNLKRGQVLCANHLPKITQTILAKIIVTRPINPNTALSFHCATQNEMVKFKRVDQIWDTANLLPKKGPLKINDLAQVILETAHKVVTEKYQDSHSLGRFVLVDSRQKISAIGVIL